MHGLEQQTKESISAMAPLGTAWAGFGVPLRREGYNSVPPPGTACEELSREAFRHSTRQLLFTPKEDCQQCCFVCYYLNHFIKMLLQHSQIWNPYIYLFPGSRLPATQRLHGRNAAAA
jgi:hypothetical protein